MKRKYSTKFKATVVDEYFNGTPILTIPQIAKKFNLPQSTVRTWTSKLKDKPPAKIDGVLNYPGVVKLGDSIYAPFPAKSKLDDASPSLFEFFLGCTLGAILGNAISAVIINMFLN